ncbi:ATP-dependent RecD-like DNA helicase [Erysipelothrix urinaevulpis]|uniref:SF1B family DNA helicase RecD2 n=1 Tax=Erysipelothrix urinaevulpis TaxID=2683717 RepID=UPI0013595C43|nr:ATP-dependent RecD-like DNA helicase [Erysipelothrix urinaevulpis]
MLEIKGLVETRIFVSEQSGFGIFRIALLDEDGSLTIKGPLSQLKKESSYLFKGEYHDDPRYGIQLNVYSYEEILPSEKEHVLKYLSGPSFPGIGIKSAEAIVEKYGEDVLELISQDESFTIDIPGVSKERLQNICDTIRKQSPLDQAITLMLSSGFSSKQVASVSKEYDQEALAVIEENPYLLMMHVTGVGFRTVDQLAKDLGIGDDDSRRLQALILDQYQKLTFGRGDSFLYLEEFFDRLDESLYPYLKDAIAGLIDLNMMVFDEGKLYHHTQYESEVFVSDFIKTFEYRGYDFEIPHFESSFETVEDDLSLKFDESQKEAIQEFLKNDLMVLTGGPGTGKSTLLSGIVSLLQNSCPWLHITLCAPTGRAAKRLTELTNVHAATVHSVLRWEPDGNTFGQNEDNPLQTDVLIVDEFSMVDIWLLNHLLKASKNVKKILFVGDKDQLPSVGPGFVLGDLIESKQVPVFFLERNYRQEEGSEVVDLALTVKDGQFDLEGYGDEVKFFDSRYGPVHEIVTKVVDQALSRNYSIYDIQVLAPKYEGVAGINTLNHVLQKTFNPPTDEKLELQVGSTVFREGDKILQLKNQPDDMVFNGDVGELIAISGHEIIVDFEGNMVSYLPVDYLNITHAYCMSVHKAQGSEYPIVILLADPSYGIMLSRRLYYTGLTRSSKSLVLVGDYDSFVKASKNQNESHRYTYLKERLERA